MRLSAQFGHSFHLLPSTFRAENKFTHLLNWATTLDLHSVRQYVSHPIYTYIHKNIYVYNLYICIKWSPCMLAYICYMQIHVIRIKFEISAFTSIRAYTYVYVCEDGQMNVESQLKSASHNHNCQTNHSNAYRMAKFQSDVTPHRFNHRCSIDPTTQINRLKAWPQVQQTHMCIYMYVHVAAC